MQHKSELVRMKMSDTPLLKKKTTPSTLPTPLSF